MWKSGLLCLDWRDYLIKYDSFNFHLSFKRYDRNIRRKNYEN